MRNAYKEYLPFATPRQAEYIDALSQHGGQKKAAAALGVNPRTLERALASLKLQAARRGYAPDYDMVRPAPDGYVHKGTSTLYDSDGNISAQWVKTDRDIERMAEMAQRVIASMSEDIRREKPVKAPKTVVADLLNLYPITDYHFGMKAWGEETGADWDMQIAEDTLFNWFAEAISASPPAATGVLALMGDFLHWDGLEAVTPEHRNILDADTRFAKLIDVATNAVRRVVRMLLTKHATVHIIIAEGNHDPASSPWLRKLFALLYEKEPRVTVDMSPNPYYCYEFGQTSLFFHHGHRRKPGNVAEVFAKQFRDVYGRTRHSYAHVGHRHSSETKETNLMIVEQHRTLAAPDAYSARGGWLSGRGASVITYSADHGEVGRITRSPEMCQTG